MRSTLANNIGPGTVFFHHLNKYVACTNKQSHNHPARGMPGLLAYHIQDHRPVVPVRFNANEKVWLK